MESSFSCVYHRCALPDRYSREIGLARLQYTEDLSFPAISPTKLACNLLRTRSNLEMVTGIPYLGMHVCLE